jgi:hypothetical protein
MKMILWGAYWTVAFAVTFVSLFVNPWFGFAVALAFIFGPKIWKNL